MAWAEEECFGAGVYVCMHAYTRVHPSDRLIQSEVPGLATITASDSPVVTAGHSWPSPSYDAPCTEMSTHLCTGQCGAPRPLAARNQAC